MVLRNHHQRVTFAWAIHKLYVTWSGSVVIDSVSLRSARCARQNLEMEEMSIEERNDWKPFMATRWMQVPNR